MEILHSIRSLPSRLSRFNGTGAEVSPIAVIFHDEAQVNMNIINPFVNADIALPNPDLILGLPPFRLPDTVIHYITQQVTVASPAAVG